MSCQSEVLEDYGISDDGWQVLQLIKQRPGLPLAQLSGAMGIKDRLFRGIASELSSLGYVKEHCTSGKDSYVMTDKGVRTVTEIRSSFKSTPEQASEEVPDFPIHDHEGEHVSDLFELASVVMFASACEVMSPEWLQILSILRGVEIEAGQPVRLTPEELVAYMGDDYAGELDVLTTKLRARVKNAKKLKTGQRWLESEEADGAFKVGLTQAGRDALEMVRQDLLNRLQED